MKKNIVNTIMILATALWITACGGDGDHDEEGHEHGEEGEGGHEEHGEHGEGETLHLSDLKFQSMGVETGLMSKRNMSSYIEVNGDLKVPPQNEASVTAIIGANVHSINVIEGDRVKKGSLLAYLSHPDLIDIQTNYISKWHELKYLKVEYERQEKLLKEKVGAGKNFQKAESDYLSMKGQVAGIEAELRMLKMNVKKIQEGKIYERVPVYSPMSGHVRLVDIKIGQYVPPEKEMFQIVNVDHIHADFMVFEKDAHKVSEGQKVVFSVQSRPNQELTAVVNSVGKAFEKDPKAIHLHAEIENRDGVLIPGMYVRGKISVDDNMTIALPSDAVVRDGGEFYIFTVKQEEEDGKTEWEFSPIEVKIGAEDNGWIEIKLFEELAEDQLMALNNAYYLLAEMKKGEAEHTH
jgi:membrane fusion protein, heavy metal efflux system